MRTRPSSSSTAGCASCSAGTATAATTRNGRRDPGPGTLAVLPRRIPHAFVVTSSTARLLTLVTPAGFEQFVVEAGSPADAPMEGPPDVAALTAMGARYGVRVVGPPPVP
ncbi:hypothetical protein [Streptomyces formicae]|uniref:Uncharacterized protein n=1 Tax=Streptomyces formicae TaxID=1616117 RepID=A0ABY3WTW8_9ACTN|nr:hypothetical protein [Streptomyces formicae]UNM16084.1 hypothetical protein J4032_35620 [Streptomyces formicae]